MSEKNYASRQSILSSKMPINEIDVPEWGGVVKYIPMTMALRREIRKKSSEDIIDANGNPRSEIDAEKFEIYSVIYCCKDPEDIKKPLFDISDYLALQNQICAGPLSRIANKIVKESGLTPENIKSSKKEDTE